MSRLRSFLLPAPAPAQALILLGLAAALAAVVNAAHPGGLSWDPTPPSPPGAGSAGASDIGLAEAAALHGQGRGFLDARHPADYASGHIPGARNVSPEFFADQVEALLADGPKDRPLVVYCQDPACPMAHELAENLALLGYTGVRVFTGGMAEWTAAGNPATPGEAP